MTWHRRALLPVLFFAAAACNDALGPAEGDALVPEPTHSLHHLRWATTMTPDRFTAIGVTGSGNVFAPVAGPSINAAVDGLDNLSTYQVSFWAVEGEDRAIQINYLTTDSTGQQTSSPYLRFTVPEEGLMAWPDGRRVAEGDSVLITISTDSTEIVAHMEPSGLEFDPDHPAELEVWYDGADPDLNTDGSVNNTDEYIEENELGVWVQQSAADPWQWVPSQHALYAKSFQAWLEHFSSYVISW